MGLSFNRYLIARRNSQDHQYHGRTTSSSSSTTETSTNTTTNATNRVNSPSLSLQSSPPRPRPLPLPLPPSPAPLPRPTIAFAVNAPYPMHPNLTPSTSRNSARPMTGHANLRNGLAPFPLLMPRPQPQPLPLPPYMSAKRVENTVNVHKNTIKLNEDANDSNSLLVSFTFDALVDGSITIFYYAKEGRDCKFSPLYPDYYMPMRIRFQKGLGQKFLQPSGTGIDKGFIGLLLCGIGELASSSSAEGVFPLVISVETCLPPILTMTNLEIQPLPITSPSSWITQAVLEKTKEGQFQVRVIKQILWIDGVRYELKELYGIGNSDESGFNKGEPGNECIICLTKPKDIAVLPCPHMCMCSNCAKALRAQSNKCPICRQLIEELIRIKVD